MSCEAADISVFAQMPKLRVLHFGSADCVDFSPLAGCRQLRELGLTLGKAGFRVGTQWPNVKGLEKLEQLETLSLSGNLFAFAPGVTGRTSARRRCIAIRSRRGRCANCRSCRRANSSRSPAWSGWTASNNSRACATCPSAATRAVLSR